jgi:predicted DCC family thiol-disulfide oxidoreductase YuxK
MSNGWTGGQYSLYRLVLGTWLAWSLTAAGGEARWGIALCVLLAAGALDRIAAAGLLGLLTWLCAHQGSLWTVPALCTGWLLVAHLLTPPAPYGSWARRRKADPGIGWRMPRALHLGSWLVLAASYGLTGFAALDAASFDTALHLSFVPLAAIPQLRPWIWSLMLMRHGVYLLAGWGSVPGGVVMVHLLAFNPAWVRRREAPQEMVFYDGRCGLCHRAVRFTLAEDPNGNAFRFAPLQSPALEAAVPPEVRLALPDSIVVMTASGDLLTGSSAVLHILRRLGGFWSLLSLLARVIPGPARDALYNLAAAIRYRLFARPSDLCPAVPPQIRSRFDL